MLLEEVRETIEKKYNLVKREYTFTNAQIAKKLKVETSAVRESVLVLEKQGLIERTDLAISRITWRTCLGKRE
ncbi:MAG: hypothetical protein IMZ53_15670 [Thermoplasmata archaeon]|nr:hypothetical protein [Thermoplasmata archaeon]MBE3142012.1 hypothetical protein [Thermoplasmata archaeon]